MLYGISGTHGTGKSSLLSGIEHLEPITAYKNSLARDAQVALGWSDLSPAEKSAENMWALQNAILKELINRDNDLVATGGDWIVERTPADLYAYTYWWCFKNGIRSPETHQPFMEYLSKLLDHSRKIKYNLVFFVPQCETVPFVPEPRRASLESRNFVEDKILEYLDLASHTPYYRIMNSSVFDRLDEMRWQMPFGSLRGM